MGKPKSRGMFRNRVGREPGFTADQVRQIQKEISVPGVTAYQVCKRYGVTRETIARYFDKHGNLREIAIRVLREEGAVKPLGRFKVEDDVGYGDVLAGTLARRWSD
jgi:ribosomal protein S25